MREEVCKTCHNRGWVYIVKHTGVDIEHLGKLSAEKVAVKCGDCRSYYIRAPHAYEELISKEYHSAYEVYSALSKDDPITKH